MFVTLNPSRSFALINHVINTPYWDIRAQFPDLMVYGEERNVIGQKINGHYRTKIGVIGS